MSNRIDIGYGLALNFTQEDGETIPSDVWIQFHGSDGKSAAVSIAAEAERMSGIIGDGLRSWASDRIKEYLARKTPPTIAELDAILNSEDDREITINPDGSISPLPPPEREP